MKIQDSHSLGKSLSAHLGVTWGGQIRMHRRTRDPTEEELEESFLDHLNPLASSTRFLRT